MQGRTGSQRRQRPCQARRFAFNCRRTDGAGGFFGIAQMSKVTHSWAIYRLRGSPAAMLGIVYATDEQTAIAKAIEEFEIEPRYQGRLIAQRRD
jgi:hypothetical protein